MPKRLPGLATKTERARLPKSDKPVWVRISRGTGLGYRANTAGDGTWVWRQSRHDGSGNYHTATIGTADDTRSADGRSVLSYDQAAKRARRMTVGSTDAGAVVSTIADALEAYGDYLRQNGREKHNVGRIKRHLPKSLAGRPIAATTEHEFASFRNILSRKMAPISVNRTMRGLKAALNRFADRSIDRSAWTIGLASLELPKGYNRARNETLTDDEIRRVVSAARADSAEFGLLVEVCAATGARVSQLRNCTCGDVKGDTLCIPVSKKGRGNHDVAPTPVPIAPALAAKLRLAAAHRKPYEVLLLKPTGKPWLAAEHRKPFARAVAACALDPKRKTLYALRHSSITRQIVRGVPARLIAEAHNTSLEMLQRHYSAEIKEQLEQALRPHVFDTEETIADVVKLRR